MWKESSKSVKCAVVFIFSMLAINTVGTIGTIANNQKLEAELAVITKQCSHVDSAGYCQLTEEQANQIELDLLTLKNLEASTVNAQTVQCFDTHGKFDCKSSVIDNPEMMERFANYHFVNDQRNRAFDAELVNYWELISRLTLYLTGFALMIVMVTRKDKNSKAFLNGEAKPEDKSQEEDKA